MLRAFISSISQRVSLHAPDVEVEMIVVVSVSLKQAGGKSQTNSYHQSLIQDLCQALMGCRLPYMPNYSRKFIRRKHVAQTFKLQHDANL